MSDEQQKTEQESPADGVVGPEAVNADAASADAVGGDTVSADDVVVADTAPAGRNRRKVLLASVVAVLVLALAGGVAYLGWNHYQVNQAEQARTDATSAAKAQAEKMFSYDYGNVEKEMAAASNGLTGDFKKQFDTLVKQQVVPAAKEKQLTVKAIVVGQAPISTTPDSAVVLLFVNQIANGNTGPNASFTPSRIKMDMKKVDGNWLVGGLETI
ncbi:h domain protein [Rhodococcus sp. D2-41]|uniref:H domain protein n=1 Tax=Speluncibacter jeojiensis TaxID=2710754 RepID=A0A9X4M4L0_9ACTN|nr:h domain protein [Rhodococcus sp. D2-41]MDG3011520.1 h domain protein [Rhodococcus sp. D2-41]MDG3015123.1 h domain protein [Corynebacteriales bacterium D3-21]